ncbi:putative Tetratricopeptide repeat protein 36-like protein [Hypsibius exemplaris]|uniref:Tetratricopeptide repeat protein 36-like protein n=1 Tax=Hypsibius exemplaris TaxID=2072580 RepID=A0A1W0WF46_HYPEX|nr:putative Tetratricopeptide repeat protein 36-like protein [Hypsibius exemplaris]
MTTENDRSVLDSIFSPLLPGAGCDIVTEAGDEKDTQLEDESAAMAEDEVSRLEIEGVRTAEEGTTERAIELFTEAIAHATTQARKASIYNNRAQALQIKGDIEGALADLNVAISLCPKDVPHKVASSAYTQRGTIRRLKGDMSAALEDYKKAAALGNRFAQQQIVLQNPMAALCSNMLAEVFSKLQKGQPVD